MSKRQFSRTNIGPGLFALLLLMNSDGSMAADSPQAEIRFQPGREGTVWVGQELELNLDLFSTGFSFGGQQFILPEVSGAYLLQADSSTVKLTEKRGGESWQGLRYSILLYPQRQGQLDIPSFEVSFTASAGYGQESASFRFETEPLRIEARLPPGVDGTGLLVTSADFSLTTEWKPRQSGEDVMQLKVGDALSLTINRQAVAVPGMVFSPLPEFSVEGLQAYPEAPRVNDRINRGELIGARTDSLTFICQREGSYEIPGIRFQWWDPEREVLNEEISPGLSFEVIPNPAYGAVEASEAGRRSLISWKQLLLGIPVLALLLIAGWKASGLISRLMQQRREQRESGEVWAFRQALKACASATPQEAYAAVTLWMTRFEPANGGLTLLQLAKASGEHELYHEVERLQLAVVSGAEQDWNGAPLGCLLRGLRTSKQHRPAKQYGLVALNPK
jgi:hypothetical protein